LRIVLDTKVLVSGLLSPTGAPGRIVDLVTSGNVVVHYDDRIIMEYRDVLARPRLRIPPQESAAVLDLVEAQGLLTVAPPLNAELPDPDDLWFLEVAVAASADALVTGNERHFAPARETVAVPILSPAAFLSRWVSEHGE
jgi:putative PIN family toxin of toxin-antitoxin system